LVRLMHLGENWRPMILLWSLAGRLLGPPPACFPDPVGPARDALDAQQFDATRREAELLNLPGALAIAQSAVPMAPSPTASCR
jgi:hypothetical protein